MLRASTCLWSVFPSDALDCTAINTWQDTLANEISYSDISFLGSDSSGLGYFCRTIYSDLRLCDSTKTFFTADGNEINIPENYLDALNSLIPLDNKLLLTLNGADGNTYCTLLNPADGSALDPFFVPDSPYGNSRKNDSILALGFCDSVGIYNIDTGEKQMKWRADYFILPPSLATIILLSAGKMMMILPIITHIP